jgi:hypothetical protein
LVVVTPKTAAPTSKSSPAGPTSPPANSSAWQDTTQYAVLIGEQAAVEAVVVALGPSGSIRTDPKTLVRGVLCAQTSLCHNGKLAGAVMVVGACTDCVHPPGGQQILNTIAGSIVPLDTIDRCVFPSFMGKPYVFEWIEN